MFFEVEVTIQSRCACILRCCMCVVYTEIEARSPPAVQRKGSVDIPDNLGLTFNPLLVVEDDEKILLSVCKRYHATLVQKRREIQHIYSNQLSNIDSLGACWAFV